MGGAKHVFGMLGSDREAAGRWSYSCCKLNISHLLSNVEWQVRMLGSDEEAMVDRRVVVKLLTTYFERNQSPEVLALMGRMLGFSGALPPRPPPPPLTPDPASAPRRVSRPSRRLGGMVARSLTLAIPLARG